jgi:hypothetical protein
MAMTGEEDTALDTAVDGTVGADPRIRNTFTTRGSTLATTGSKKAWETIVDGH